MCARDPAADRQAQSRAFARRRDEALEDFLPQLLGNAAAASSIATVARLPALATSIRTFSAAWRTALSTTMANSRRSRGSSPSTNVPSPSCTTMRTSGRIGVYSVAMSRNSHDTSTGSYKFDGTCSTRASVSRSPISADAWIAICVIAPSACSRCDSSPRRAACATVAMRASGVRSSCAASLANRRSRSCASRNGRVDTYANAYAAIATSTKSAISTPAIASAA